MHFRIARNVVAELVFRGIDPGTRTSPFSRPATMAYFDMANASMPRRGAVTTVGGPREGCVCHRVETVHPAVQSQSDHAIRDHALIDVGQALRRCGHHVACLLLSSPRLRQGTGGIAVPGIPPFLDGCSLAVASTPVVGLDLRQVVPHCLPGGGIVMGADRFKDAPMGIEAACTDPGAWIEMSRCSASHSEMPM